MTTGEVNYRLKADASGFTSEVAKAERSVSGLDKSQKETAKSADSLSAAYKSVGIGIAAMAGAGLLAMRKVIQETSESDAVMAQLNVTLQATGGAAGKTAEALVQSANALQKVTTYSDEAVLSAETLLLSFKNIKGDVFDRTTKAVLDLSTAMHMDLNVSAKLVGKALEDPEKGMTKLAKAGVILSDGTKETIKALTEMGDVAGAQSVLLEELEGRFEGSAVAARDTLGGALKGLENSWSELFEVSSGASNGMADGINRLSETLSDPQIKESITSLVSGLIAATDWAIKFGAAMNWAYGTGARQNLVDMSDAITDVKAKLKDAESGRTVDFVAAGKLRKELETLNKAYDAEVKAINGRSAAQANGAKATSAATEETKKGTATGLVSVATREKEAKAADKLAKEEAKLVAEKEKTRSAIAKLIEAEVKATKAIDDYISSIAEETRALGLSERAQFINNKVKGAGKDLSEANRAAIEKESAALYDQGKALEDAAAAADAAAQASTAAWENARATLSEFFFEMAADGKNAFETLIKGFQAMITKMIAEAAANKILLAVGVGGSGSLVSAASSAASSAAGGTGAASWVSSVTGTLQNGFNMLASSYEGVANLAQSAGFQNVAGAARTSAGQYTGSLSSSAMNAGLNVGASIVGSYAGTAVFGETTGIGSTVGGIIGSIWGPVGTAIGSFIGSGLEKGLAKLTGHAGENNDHGGGSFDTSSGQMSLSTTGKNNQNSLNNANDIYSIIKGFSDALQGDISGNIRTGKDGLNYNGQKFSSPDDLLSAAFTEIIKSSEILSDSLKTLVLDFNGTAQEIATFSAVVLSIDALSKVNTVTNAVAEFNKVVDNSVQSYYGGTSTLLDLIAAFDGSLAAADAINAALIANKTAAYDFAIAIQQIGASIKQSAEDAAASIRESVMTQEQLNASRLASRDAMEASLETIIDPAKLQAVTEKILDLNRQLFDALPDSERLRRAEEFASYDEQVGELSGRILDEALGTLGATQEDINIRVSQMLGTASEAQTRAAQTQLDASNTFARYVELLVSNGIPITLPQSQGTLNLGDGGRSEVTQ